VIGWRCPTQVGSLLLTCMSYSSTLSNVATASTILYGRPNAFAAATATSSAAAALLSLLLLAGCCSLNSSGQNLTAVEALQGQGSDASGLDL
jgi:hypothetical protein